MNNVKTMILVLKILMDAAQPVRLNLDGIATLYLTTQQLHLIERYVNQSVETERTFRGKSVMMGTQMGLAA